MNADGDIDAEEKEYIRILIKSFEMDESTLDSFVAFAQSPDKDTVQAFFRTFRRRPIAQLFLFDALMISRRDGKADDRKTAVINKMAEQLEILKGTQNDIYDLFCHMTNRNWQESALYFSSHLLNPEHFKHLLDYHEVDFDELMTETVAIQQTRLLEIIRGKIAENITFEWKVLSYLNSGCMPENMTEITTDCVDMSTVINTELILPYLQARLDRGELRVNSHLVYFTDAAIEDEGEFFGLENTGFAYNQEDRSFYALTDRETTFEIPDSIIESFCACICAETNANTPEDINKILATLFNAQIAVSGKGTNTIFPRYKGSDFIVEILLHYQDKKFIQSSKENYTRRPEYLDNITIFQVLMSKNFRLMR